MTETIYVDVFGVNDSPTLLDVSAPVNYTERSPPIQLAPHAMPIDDDLQPIDVPIDHLEITVLGNETGTCRCLFRCFQTALLEFQALLLIVLVAKLAMTSL